MKTAKAGLVFLVSTWAVGLPGRLYRQLALLFACAALLSPALACEVSLRRNPDTATLVRLPSGELTGPRQATISAALNRMGCTVRLVDLPWARALLDLESGDLDVLPGMFKTPEREAFAHFSGWGEPSINRLFVLRKAASQWKFRDLAEIRSQPFRLGVQVRVSYGSAFDQLLQDPAFSKKLVRVSSRQSLWRMLALGRLDGVLADETGGPFELRQLGLAFDIQATDVVLRGDVAFTGFSRKRHDAAFVKRFDAVLHSMELDGSRAAIEKRLEAATGAFGAGAPVRASEPGRSAVGR